ncbi:MAG: hypothetical protein E7355_01990 [Clostridiales bacterium]|nr:hypothetical protein [Clostridiales bacterium]
MKAKLLKLLRLVGYVVPLLAELIKKLALGLMKKLTGIANWTRGCLNRVQQVCDTSHALTEDVEEKEV